MKTTRVLVVVLLVLAVAGCGDKRDAGPPGPTATPAPAPTAGPSRLPECPESGVVVWLGEASAAMGIRVMGVELYNCGGRDQVLNGYPGVRLLGSDLVPIKVAVRHGSGSVAQVDSFDQPAHEVTLKPGEVASAGILWRNLVTDDPGKAVTADVLEITPRPSAPTELVRAAGIDLGTTRKVGISPWKKIREANGVEPGDNAPHQGDNNAWQQRLELSPDDRMAGELAAGKLYVALEPLRKQTPTVDSVRSVLLGLGFSTTTTSTRADAASGGVAFEVYPGGRACIHGSVAPDHLTMKVAGVRMEGGCVEP
ncbi:MAG: DUF4232 domain-containing protein [Streptosporangiaceae bacterium]